MSRSSATLVPPAHIRRLFNEGRYQERLDAGELVAELRKSKHPSAPRARMPVCTRSQTLVYLNGRRRFVAIVHQYLLPSGRLGASGRPDPKLLRHEGRIYQAFG